MRWAISQSRGGFGGEKEGVASNVHQVYQVWRGGRQEWGMESYIGERGGGGSSLYVAALQVLAVDTRKCYRVTAASTQEEVARFLEAAI